MPLPLPPQSTRPVVVDVAGGRGELSMVLCLLGLPSLVMDPRPNSGQLCGRLRKAVRRRGVPPVQACRTLFPPPSASPPPPSPSPPVHHHHGYSSRNITVSGEVASPSVDQTVAEADNDDSDRAAARGKGDAEEGEVEEADSDLAAVSEPPAAGAVSGADAAGFEALQHCSAVVGLHPDECTEAIVDWAVENGKTFAVVPCCVFSRLFPGRTMPVRAGGVAGLGFKAVRSFDDFVDYLAAKHPAIQRTRLGFNGKNTCLYAYSADLRASEQK